MPQHSDMNVKINGQVFMKLILKARCMKWVIYGAWPTDSSFPKERYLEGKKKKKKKIKRKKKKKKKSAETKT